MEITLGDGWLAAYPCGERLWISYAMAVLVAAVLALPAVAIVKFAGGKKTSPYASENAKASPDPRTPAFAVAAFYTAAILVAALVLPLSGSRTRLFATETTIVETGCRILTPYTEVLDRSLAEIRYRHRRGKGQMDRLEVRQEGKPTQVIALKNNPYLRNLVEVAPMAVSQYIERLKAEGKPVPEL